LEKGLRKIALEIAYEAVTNDGFARAGLIANTTYREAVEAHLRNIVISLPREEG
jgi:hypothetical protein